MARLVGNYVQSLGQQALDELPELCTYRGNDPALAKLKGLLLPTVHAENLVFIGERENIWVEDFDGNRWQPWKFCAIVELDGAGQAMRPKHEPIVARGPNAMAAGDLAALGHSDATLAELAMELLGEEWVPDRPGPSDKRREMYDRVIQKAMFREPDER